MLENPKNWEMYYKGSQNEKHIKRFYSLSDRCRYYFANDYVQDVIKKLFTNINSVHIPLGLLRQYMPVQYIKVRDGKLICKAEELVKDKIIETIDDYNYATKYNYIIGNIFVG